MTNFRMTRARGFTVVELMVAFLLSTIVVAAVFAVMVSSSRSFRIQGDTAQTIDRLNFAMETVKMDLRRAGYMTVPNAYADPADFTWYETACAPPAWLLEDGNGGVAHGIFFDDAAPSASNNLYAPRTRDQVFTGRNPDRVSMLGNYRSTQTFRPEAISAGSNQIVVGHTADQAALVDDIFTGAMVSVTTPQGGSQFLNVTAVENVSPVSTRLTASTNLLADPTLTGANDNCRFSGFGSTMYEVTPLHFVRYSVVNDPDELSETALIREELSGGYADLNPASRYVVARNVVDFQVWFDNDIGAPGFPQLQRDTSWGNDEGAMANTLVQGTTTSTPEDARYAYVQLSARLDSPVARNINVGSGDLLEFMEMRTWDGASYQYTGEFTRVLTIRGEVELSNFSISALR